MPANCWTCRHFAVGSWNEPCATCVVKTPWFGDGVLWEAKEAQIDPCQARVALLEAEIRRLGGTVP